MVEKMTLDKAKAHDLALATIEKAYGKGSVFNYGIDKPLEEIPKYSTGILGLDIALGGGVPQGRIIEIYGPESSGKTTLTLEIAAQVQKATGSGKVGFIDAEHALDICYAEKLGVDVKNLDIAQPDNGEQALEICDIMVKSGAYSLVIVDSVAALTPKAELEGEMGDSHMGLQARLMSQALRKLTGSVSRTNCIVIFINQLRMKIGVMFGNPETTTGGNALKFYASVRMDIRRTGQVKEGEEVVANATKIKVVKNKVAPPFKEVELQIAFGKGFNKEHDLIEESVKAGVVEKSGAWYSYKNAKIGQGMANSCQYLVNNPEIAAEIRAMVMGGEIPT
jgi:recombination protein RecA